METAITEKSYSSAVSSCPQSFVDKMIQQRNISQMKKQNKTSGEQLSEVEISNLPEKNSEK